MQLKSILRQLLKERGISISNLSKATKVPQQTLHNWLSGTEPRSLSQVKKVADFLEVTLDYVCFGIEQSSKQKIESYQDEINAGVFEVVLRRVKIQKIN